jgi:CRISPR-associated protein Csd2
MAVATETEAKEQYGDNRTIGRKNTVPYGLYVSYGFISPAFACKTGFDEDDLKLFWEAVRNMFECDRSAAKGLMSARKLYVFKHSSELGNMPANKLFDLIEIKKKNKDKPPRDFSDYEVKIKENILDNVTRKHGKLEDNKNKEIGNGEIWLTEEIDGIL